MLMLNIQQNKFLSKFIFNFVYPEKTSLKSLSGRIAMGSFLQFLNERNALLPKDLHTNNNRRPYVVSNIRFKNTKDVKIGFFSVTTIDLEIIDIILQSLLEANLSIYVNNNHCEILKIDYLRRDISVPKLLPKGTTFRIRFLTPTLFANDNRLSKIEPYPRLEFIWNNLLNTYEFLVGKLDELDKSLFIRNAVNQIATPDFQLRSKHLEMGKNIKLTAFTGFILFKIENENYLELLLPLLEIADFWGIGGKRSMGLGNISVNVKIPDIS